MNYLAKSTLQINSYTFTIDDDGLFINVDATGIVAEQRKRLVEFMQTMNDTTIQITLTQSYGSTN